MKRFKVTAFRFDGHIQSFTVSAPTQTHAESLVRRNVAMFSGIGCNASDDDARKPSNGGGK